MDATTAGTGQHDHHVFVQKFIGLAYSIKISIKNHLLKYYSNNTTCCVLFHVSNRL